jgi:hypothetical protein
MRFLGFFLVAGVSTLLLNLGAPQSSWAQARLETPTPGSSQSGIGLVRGCVCNAQRVDIVFDNSTTVQAAYGTSRGDTTSVCGDDNNGFDYQVNWNLLSNGTHTVQALADGVEFARAVFTVQTLGTVFLRDASGGQTFSFNGCAVTVVWEESQQNFMIVDMSTCLAPLLGRWEFVTTTSTGQLRNHYLLQQFETETSGEVGVSLEGISGSDLEGVMHFASSTSQRV